VIGTRDRQCKYVYNRWTSRCTDAVKALCPVSCAQSCTPVDTVGKFELRPGVLKTCKWASNNVSKRCRNYVVHANCPVACGVNPE
jgi:hypothetical protein